MRRTEPTSLTGSQLAALWRRTQGRLPNGGAWTLRTATRADVAAGRAKRVGARLIAGPACAAADRPALRALLREEERRQGVALEHEVEALMGLYGPEAVRQVVERLAQQLAGPRGRRRAAGGVR